MNTSPQKSDVSFQSSKFRPPNSNVVHCVAKLKLTEGSGSGSLPAVDAISVQEIEVV